MGSAGPVQGSGGRGRTRLVEGVEKLKQQSRGKFDVEEYLPTPLRSLGKGGPLVSPVPDPDEAGAPVLPTRGKMPSFFRALSFHTPTNEVVKRGTAEATSGGGVEVAPEVNPLRESTGSTDTSPFSVVSNTPGSKNGEGSEGGSGGSTKETSGLEVAKNEKAEDVAASGVFARGSLT